MLSILRQEPAVVPVEDNWMWIDSHPIAAAGSNKNEEATRDEITYDALWTLYPPGSVVCSQVSGTLSAFEVGHAEYDTQRSVFDLVCTCVAHDGKHFGRILKTISIPEFSGVKSVAEFEVLPWSIAEAQDRRLGMKLTARGQVYEDLTTGYHLKQYNADAVDWDGNGCEVPLNISGYILIDLKAFRLYRGRDTPDLEKLTVSNVKACESYGKLYETDEDPQYHLSSHHHLLTSARIPGYSLQHSRWLEFFVDRICPASYAIDSWQTDILGGQRKDVVGQSG